MFRRLQNIGTSPGIRAGARVYVVETFTGNGTWTRPIGVDVVDVQVVAGGGGGISGANGYTGAGGGGGTDACPPVGARPAGGVVTTGRVRTSLLAALGVAFGAFCFSYLTLPDVRGLARTNPTTTAFMELRKEEAAQDGRTLAVRHRWVPYNQIATELRRAVIVTEDAAFFDHDGIDLNEDIDAYLNLRYLGGGAEGTSDGNFGDGFTKNWLHFATVSLGFTYDVM